MTRKKLVMFTLMLSSMTLTFCAPGKKNPTSSVTVPTQSSRTLPVIENDNDTKDITITNSETGEVIATLHKTVAELKNMVLIVNSDATVTTFKVSKSDFTRYNNKEGSQQLDFLKSLAQKYNVPIN